MNHRSLTEEELQTLVQEAQGGSTQAFEKLYNVFFDPVYRYTAFRLPEDLVEDAVADIFVKSWEKLHTYHWRRHVPFGAWLFRIARYTVIDVYRTQRGFDEIPEDLEDPDEFSRADTRVKRQDLLNIVRRAMQQLPKRYREVLVLSFVSDLPNKAVARVLRLTEGGVRILKLRALRKLEKLLPPDVQSDQKNA
ncbi:sigma-70 family RNA polymerase sigma factor [Candidatus Peregrinibacteria bacterium]|nr:sigma-70 family RNA polymerase sigma factor [Candidatus Peregrinibacteria bacterium]